MPVMVVIPTNGYGRRRVVVDKVQRIRSNRVVDAEEQYLVQWKVDTRTNTPPLSWHAIEELVRCLDEVQDYLDARAKSIDGNPASTKRKTPDTTDVPERRASPFDRLRNNRTPSASRSSSVSSAAPTTIDVYNGVLDADDDGFIFCRPFSGTDIPSLDIRKVPTPDMTRTARSAKVERALRYIRAEYIRRLGKLPGPQIHLYNTVDASTPSLRFRYISDYVLTEGVYRMPLETQQGCQQCSPHMGRSIGCEYTRKCDCLEYAAVDESRITSPQMLAEYQHYQTTRDGGTMGFPKKFPYFAEGTKIQRTGCLVPFYLNSRRPIYECNDKCACGPYCRNKLVQFGRTVQLEIFKTNANDGRGWGLRAKEDLHEGQFIDTYRGEIVTDAVATARETASSNAKAKASYLYSLDKFAESENLPDEDLYVVDGEFMGGPTKFINHCCQPNCRQYTVSYNKHDCRVYDIAFFACRFIPKGEELTFDYLDQEDEGEGMDEPGEGAIPCLCGAAKCRKWLWT
ncbi:SET domain-containing protein [Ophiobolus disseminans]|uniref:SET domain-containing protein n=1 Tax=Ophiobolus disseminans TaxID=1469910 RepID=A0A6A7AHR2_9PLEO|nr:SET domain-containing protein [Ophiobolus disseminans]